MNAPEHKDNYYCPGENHPITRAVHLGRLANLYHVCEQCPHRYEAGELSPRRVRQNPNAVSKDKLNSLFYKEGAGGVSRNDFVPKDARNIAAAFGVYVGSLETKRTCSLPQTEACDSPAMPSKDVRNCDVDHGGKNIVLAGDGRPVTAELVAAASEGLRWAGCNVIDVGPATVSSLVLALAEFEADGGVLVGNPGFEPHLVGLQFWKADAIPLSMEGSLDSLAAMHENAPERPTRVFGAIRRCQIGSAYLEPFRRHYHGLRPLRVVLQSASGPFTKYFQQCLASTACKVVPCRVIFREIAGQVQEDSAHFAAWIDGNGETCRIMDERGRWILPEALAWLILKHVLLKPLENPISKRNLQSYLLTRAVVMDKELAADPAKGLAQRLAKQDVRVVFCESSREAMATAMRETNAIFGFGVEGRFWYPASSGEPDVENAELSKESSCFSLPDALMTITRLLQTLSLSDIPLSDLLDRESDCG